MAKVIDGWTLYTAIMVTIGVFVPIIIYYFTKPRVKVKSWQGGKTKNTSSDCLYMTVTNKLHRPIKFVSIGCDAVPVGLILKPDLSYDDSKTTKLDIPQKSFHDFWLDLNEGDKYTFCVKIDHIKKRMRQDNCTLIECF